MRHTDRTDRGRGALRRSGLALLLASGLLTSAAEAAQITCPVSGTVVIRDPLASHDDPMTLCAILATATLSILAPGALTNNEGIANDGAISVAPAGVLLNNGYAWTTGSFSVAAGADFDNVLDVYNEGTLVVAGAFDHSEGAGQAGTAVVWSDGSIEISSTGVWTNDATTLTAGTVTNFGTIANTAVHYVSGTTGNEASAAWTNDGVLGIVGGAATTFDNEAGATFTNGAGATLFTEATPTLTNRGIFVNEGDAVLGAAAFFNLGAGLLDNRGTLLLGGALQNDASLSNAGFLSIGASASVTGAGSFIQPAGSDGVIVAGELSQGVVDFQDGTVTGGGTISASGVAPIFFAANAVLDPGSPTQPAPTYDDAGEVGTPGSQVGDVPANLSLSGDVDFAGTLRLRVFDAASFDTLSIAGIFDFLAGSRLVVDFTDSGVDAMDDFSLIFATTVIGVEQLPVDFIGLPPGVTAALGLLPDGSLGVTLGSILLPALDGPSRFVLGCIIALLALAVLQVDRRRRLARILPFTLALGALLGPSSIAEGNARNRHDSWKDAVVYYYFFSQECNPDVSIKQHPFCRTVAGSGKNFCYEVDPGNNTCDNAEESVREAMLRIERATLLEFVDNGGPCDPNRGEFECVEFHSAGDGGWGNSRDLNAGNRGPGVNVHELTHALGFMHEQSRSDRDDAIETYPVCANSSAFYSELTMPDYQRDLLGPPDFGAYAFGGTPVSGNGPLQREVPWLPQPWSGLGSPDQAWPSIMAYSGWKSESPFQACFTRCTGTVWGGLGCVSGSEVDVTRPWTLDNDWRTWSCDASYGVGTLPGNVRGCPNSASGLATCQLCVNTYGETKLNSEQQTLADNDQVGIIEQRWYYSYFDRTKVSRKHMDIDLDDVLQVSDEDGELTFAAVESVNGVLEYQQTALRSGWSPTSTLVSGYFNGDYYSDVLRYDPVAGTSAVDMLDRLSNFQAMPITGSLQPGFEIVRAGWFEDESTAPAANLHDHYQDLFAYDADTGEAELGRFEYNASAGTWDYAAICETNIGSGWDHAVVGTFEMKSWLSQIVVMKEESTIKDLVLAGGGGNTPSAPTRLAIYSQTGPGCLEELKSFRGPAGDWTHLVAVDRFLFDKACFELLPPSRFGGGFGRSTGGSSQATLHSLAHVCPVGDKYTDLYFYDAASGDAKLWEAMTLPGQQSGAVEFKPTPNAAAGTPPIGAEQVFAADLDGDRGTDLLFFDEDGQALTALQSTQGQLGWIVTTLPTVMLGAGENWERILVGQFPNGQRPTTESVCGNGIIEDVEACDMSAIPGGSCPGQTSVCSNLCELSCQ